MHRVRPNQAHPLRHPAPGPIIRLTRLVPKRFHHNLTHAKPRQALHRNPTPRQEKTRPANPLIHDHLPVGPVHDGLSLVEY